MLNAGLVPAQEAFLACWEVSEATSVITPSVKNTLRRSMTWSAVLHAGELKQFWIQEDRFPSGRRELTSHSQHVPQKTNASPVTALSAGK